MQELKQGSLLQNGKYRIERMLGQGGFGITYEGIQTGLNRRVAIKEFFMKEYCNRDASTSHVSVGTVGSTDMVSDFRQKFLKEAQLIARLEDAPHVVRIHDIFEENGTAYYVMEFLGGGSLSSLLKERGTLSETDAIAYIRQVGEALTFLHAHNTLHLDVKPSNILLNKKGEVVLIDFGVSKHYDQSGSQTSSTPVGLSKGYAPSEQYQSGGVQQFTPATDVYSLGATLYCLLKGQAPPEASIVFEDGLPPRPQNVSASTWQAITQAMQPRRKDRTQTVAQFMADLGGGSSETTISQEKHEEPADVKSEKTVVSPQQPASSQPTELKQPAPESIPQPTAERPKPAPRPVPARPVQARPLNDLKPAAAISERIGGFRDLALAAEIVPIIFEALFFFNLSLAFAEYWFYDPVSMNVVLFEIVISQLITYGLILGYGFLRKSEKVKWFDVLVAVPILLMVWIASRYICGEWVYIFLANEAYSMLGISLYSFLVFLLLIGVAILLMRHMLKLHPYNDWPRWLSVCVVAPMPVLFLCGSALTLLSFFRYYGLMESSLLIFLITVVVLTAVLTVVIVFVCRKWGTRLSGATIMERVLVWAQTVGVSVTLSLLISIFFVCVYNLIWAPYGMIGY